MPLLNSLKIFLSLHLSPQLHILITLIYIKNSLRSYRQGLRPLLKNRFAHDANESEITLLKNRFAHDANDFVRCLKFARIKKVIFLLCINF